tara:strand:- start:603 stop:2165 length:1563 start_codon:yes stop_codon:yes gene_type:complete
MFAALQYKFPQKRMRTSKKMSENDNKPALSKTRPLVKESVSALLLFGDTVAIIVAFILAMVTVPFLKDILAPEIYTKPLTEYQKIHDLFFLWLCPFVLFMFHTKGHYTQREPWWSVVKGVMTVCIMAFVLDGFMRFALKMSFSRSLITFSWVYVFFMVLASRQIIYHICRKKGLWNIPTVLIGSVETVFNSLYAFNADRFTGYDVHSVYIRDTDKSIFDPSYLPPRFKNVKVYREKFNARDYIESHLDNFFIFSLGTYRGEERDKLIKFMNKRQALYALVPPISNQISMSEMIPKQFFGNNVMLLHARSTNLSLAGRIMKRAMDIVLSIIALIIFSPIMLAVAIMLKVEGQGGSVFYGGERIGFRGKRFRCWKFRTMEPDSDHLLHELLESDPQAKADWDKYQKLKQPDPRVTTKTAALIRKTSLDELPQLWNVLKGDMSLVGPRPILKHEAKLFGSDLNHYLLVRPGITGLWQVSGRNDTTFNRRIYWDNWYVRNWSLWGDIVIMVKTVWVVLRRDGAY